MQNQTSQLSASNDTVSGNMPSITCASSFPINSPPGFVAGPSAGNVVVPSFVSTYCTLGNLSLSRPSLFGSHGLARGALPATSQFFSPAFSTPTSAHSVVSLLHKPFVVSPGYSPILERLVTKIKAGQFIDLADLLPENVKAQDSDKFKRTVALLESWSVKRHCSRKELESLIGTLHHACKIIPQGRTFIRWMIYLLSAFRHDDHPIRLNREFHYISYAIIQGTLIVFPCGRTQHVRSMRYSIVSMIQSVFEFRFMHAIPHSRLNGR